MIKLITAMEPQRDNNGYWTHPDYFVPANGAEYGAPGEFEAWKEANRVTGALQWMENHATAEQIDAYESGDGDISQWEPTRRRAMAGLSVQSTIPKMGQFVTGCALLKRIQRP